MKKSMVPLAFRSCDNSNSTTNTENTKIACLNLSYTSVSCIYMLLVVRFLHKGHQLSSDQSALHPWNRHRYLL
jgi:hypothetical protein